MKRSLVAVVVVGLLAGSLVSVAEAKKKPKPKKLVAAEQKFFLHWESAAPRRRVAPGPST